MSTKKTLDMITVGNAVRDVMYYTTDTRVVPNPKADPLCTTLICTEFGAKLRSEEVYFLHGGGGSNTAVNFAGLGLRTGVITSIGNDLDGQGILQHLKEQGVDTTLVDMNKKHRTGFSFLLVDKKTGEHSAFVYYGAAQQLNVTPAALKRVNTKWFYVSSINPRSWKTILTRLTATQAKIAWNPGGQQLSAGYNGLKSLLKRTEILILNKDEATELVLSHPQHTTAGTIKQLLEIIQSWGPHMVMITNGRHGSFVYDGTTHSMHKPPKDHPKDTTGAGDCHGSSFVAGIIRYNGDIARALRLATANSTHLVHTIGAQQGLLRWNQLPKSLRT